MTARRTMVHLALLLAGLVVLLLAGLLLIQGARVPPPGPLPPVPAPGPDPEPLHREADGAPTAAPSAPARKPNATIAPAKPGDPFRLPTKVVFEDGSLCPFGSFLEMERGQDGSPEVVLDSAMKGGIGDDETGSFQLEWEKRPVELLLLFAAPEVEVVAAAGAGLMPPDSQGSVLVAEGGQSLEVTVRFRAGFGWIVTKDRATGTELLPLLRWRLGDGSVKDLPVEWTRGPDPGKEAAKRKVGPPPAPAGTPVLEVLVDGYAMAKVPGADVRGRIEVLLDPSVADVTGDLVVPGVAGGEGTVGWNLLAATPGDPPARSVKGNMPGPGPFTLFDVPEGRWTLEVWALTQEGVRWAARTFEKFAGPVSLGTLEVSAWSGLRARVVDADGKPLRTTVRLQPGLRAVKTGRDVRILQGSDVGFKGVFIVRDGEVERVDATGPPTPDAEGWTVLRDLRPGASYRIGASWPTTAVTEAEAPTVTGEIKDVEIRVTQRLVSCSIRLTVDGGAPSSWGTVYCEGLLAAGWNEDRTYQGSVYPGRYKISAACTRKAGGQREMVSGVVEIPEGAPFEAAVDLK